MISLKKSGRGVFNFKNADSLTPEDVAASKDGLGTLHAFNGRIAVAQAQHCYQQPVMVLTKRVGHKNTFVANIFAAGSPASV